MKSEIISLVALLFLSGCAQDHFSDIRPDVVVYDTITLTKAADEIDSGKCPVLGDVMLPDYEVMRDQARIK